MFVFSCKTSKKQLLIAAVCVGVLGVLLLCLFVRPTAVQYVAALPSASTAEEGAAYLRSLGYEAEGGELQDIQLPDTADATIDTYNALLKQAGLDITPLLGKRIQCRTYTVKNHPNGAAQAHLYLYKNKIVAGDITVDGVPTILKEHQNGTAG